MSGWGTGLSSPGLPVTRSGPAGAKYRRPSWYRQANQKEVRRDGARDSERFIVPLKQGNPGRGDPVEGRGCLVVELMVGNSAGTQGPGTLFP